MTGQGQVGVRLVGVEQHNVPPRPLRESGGGRDRRGRSSLALHPLDLIEDPLRR